MEGSWYLSENDSCLRLWWEPSFPAHAFYSRGSDIQTSSQFIVFLAVSPFVIAILSATWFDIAVRPRETDALRIDRRRLHWRYVDMPNVRRFVLTLVSDDARWPLVSGFHVVRGFFHCDVLAGPSDWRRACWVDCGYQKVRLLTLGTTRVWCRKADSGHRPLGVGFRRWLPALTANDSEWELVLKQRGIDEGKS
jgi:hypothetical protein